MINRVYRKAMRRNNAEAFVLIKKTEHSLTQINKQLRNQTAKQCISIPGIQYSMNVLSIYDYIV